MGLRDDDDDDDSRSTPKLSLSKLPCKPKHPIQMLTPPLHPSASIPFHWEEAPGRPRLSADEPPPPPSSARSRVARCLELPPPGVLMHDHEGEGEFTMMPSPAMVLGVGRSMSLACTFSFRKGPVSAAKKKNGCGSFGRSRRWRTFKFGDDEEMMVDGGGGSFDFSQSLGDIFQREKNSKMKGITRVRSFINSNLLDIYVRFKQAIPWRRKR